MFRCERCKKLSKPNERLTRLVVERRDRKYRQCADKDCRGTLAADEHDPEAAKEDRKVHAGCSGKLIVSPGWEIKREINVHERCV